MKKTTYIMIGLALGGLLVLLGSLTYIYTCTGYEAHHELHIDKRLTTRELPQFKRVCIQDLSPKIYTLSDESGRIIIEQSDTAKVGKLTMSEGWNDILHADVSGDTLILTIRVDYKNDRRSYPILYATDPIVLTVPREVMEIQNRTSNYNLTLSKFHDSTLFVSSRVSVSVDDSDIRSYVSHSGYDWCDRNESQYTQKVYLNLHRSTIDSFVSFDEVREFGLGMDSVSMINKFTWMAVSAPGVDDINLIDCRVNSFTWVNDDPSRTLTLRADIGLSARMN